MKAYIKIVGVGQRRKGLSKTQKPYDFTPVAFEYEDPFFDGVKAETVNIDQTALGSYVPAIGDSVEAVMHHANYRTFVDAIL